MSCEARALPLIERIYEAAVEPDAWSVFVEELSQAFGGAAVALSLELPDSEEPGWSPDVKFYRVGLKPEYLEVFLRHYAQGLPWGPFDQIDNTHRFVFAGEYFPDEKVVETAYYREYMQPQGLAPEGPLVHEIHASREDGQSFRRSAMERQCVGLDAD